MTNPGFQAMQAAQRAAQANRQAAAQAEWTARQGREAMLRAQQEAARFRQGLNRARPRSSSGGPIGRLVGVVIMLLITAFAVALILTVASHF